MLIFLNALVDMRGFVGGRILPVKDVKEKEN